jgi:phage baseplate assembly protein W
MEVPTYKFGLYFPILLQDGKAINPGLINSLDSSIRNILAFEYSTRFMNNKFGTFLESFLGAPMVDSTLDSMSIFIRKAIQADEQRIKIKNIDLEPNYEANKLTINIKANLIDTNEPYEFTSDL